MSDSKQDPSQSQHSGAGALPAPATTSTSGWLRTFSSLRQRSFRLFWTGNIASSAAVQMEQIARGWLVMKLTDSPFLLGLVSGGFAIPFLAFSLFGGVVADRVQKRNLLIATQAMIGFISLTIATLVVTQTIAVWHLILASVLSGFVYAFNFPCRQAYVPELVGEENEALTNAVALTSGAMNAMRMAAPALAGALVPLIGGDNYYVGVGGVYFIIVACYLLQISILFLIPLTGAGQLRIQNPVKQELVEGVNFIRRNPPLLALTALAFVPIVFGMPYITLLPFFAEDVFHVGSLGYGLMNTLVGAGALVASLAIASLGGFRRKGLLLLATALTFGIGLMLFSSTSSYNVALLFLVIVGVGGTSYMTLNNTLVMMATNPDIRGRVMSVYMMTWGLMPFGTLPSGAVAEIIGVQWVTRASGAILFAFVLIVGILSRGIRRLE